MFLISGKKVMRLIGSVSLILSLMLIATFNVNAAGTSTDVTLTCKITSSTSLVDVSSLGINISAAVPVGTIVYNGTATANFKCALDNLQQYLDGLSGEVYFKRKAIDASALGYGLTLYTGYGGEMSTDAASIATGIMISTYALTSGGTVGTYTDVSLNVPYQIVKTSNSMSASTSLKSYVNAFDVGSLVSGKDVSFNFTNIKTGITVKDQTCSVAGDTNLPVPLGSYTTNPTSGLGSGIGQTSATTAFNIQLNCEALLSGSFDVMMQLDGDASSGLSDLGVVALNSASTASGVGVQILNENQQPIALATPFNIATYPLSSALITVPLYARYYQTATKINPGSANAVATYTLSYQ
ncbi:Fimbria adhesin protein precursor (plasmid) [Pantoea vagans C9-1]|uniref:fimbrial protein n=1 Tax=Pantoea vagans TaxID=470934 RepID=UPI0001E57A32|nr:fimbrial protein [Pantoea vagans]ADO07920.1 Fimbria adhesin protein precursor [Pantoea vagans C9-1]